MTVKEIIDIALSQGDNVPESDAGYIDRRRRALSFLREVVHEVWWERDFPWKKTEADVTVLSGESSVAVPSDFDSIGVYGGVYRLVGGLMQYPPLEEVPESVVMESRTGSHTTSSPRMMALFGQDDVTQQLLIQVPVAAGDVPLRVFYQKRPPKLWDAGDPEPLVSSIGVGGLTRVGQIATAVTALPHGYEMFDRVVIAGAVEVEYNGTYEVTVLSETSFLYTIAGTPATPATGTITAVADVATGNAALRQVPERFHVKVLLNGVKAKLRESKGDARWQTLEARYTAGVTAMKGELARFQGEIRQLPSFFGERR